MEAREDEVTVAIAATVEEWAPRLTAWITDHASQARLRDHYPMDREDALAQECDVLVADADSSLLDAALVAELHRRGRGVVGVCDAEVPDARERLSQLGCDSVIPKTAAAADLAAAAVEVGRAAREDVSRLLADLVDLPGGHPDTLPHPPPADAAPARRGWLTAVTGPVDGQGATEVAVELAIAVRRRGEHAVLVDADVVAASLAQRLGVGYDRNLHTAVDAVVHGSGRLRDALTPSRIGGFALLAGVPPHKWKGVEPGDLAAVLEQLLDRHDHAIANVAAAVEELPGGRHAATRRVLAAADRIVLVADATPIGCERVCRWLGEARDITDSLARVHVAFNRAPRGRRADADAQLAGELRRCAAVGSVSTLPYDPKVLEACWAGEAAARGRFTRAAARLAEVALPAQPAASRRSLTGQEVRR